MRPAALPPGAWAYIATQPPRLRTSPGADGRAASGGPRRAFAVLLGGPDLRYHKPAGAAFPSPGRKRGLSRDDILQGAPIGDYPAAFPLCWPVS